MGAKLHPSYECQCSVPTPLMALGEDSGMCKNCNLVYDERLYEMRLRQHLPNWTYETVADYLMETSDDYRRVAANSPVE